MEPCEGVEVVEGEPPKSVGLAAWGGIVRGLGLVKGG